MKKTIITISILAVAGILGFVAYSFLASPVISQTFIDKHNEAVALGKEVSQLTDLNSMPEWNALDKHMNDGNYTDALKSIDGALIRKKDASAKLDSIDSKLSELKSISGEITDSKIKTNAEKFTEVTKSENSAKISYNNLQIQMLGKLKTMVGILVENPKTISVADEKAIDNLSQEIDGIKSQLDKAEDEVDKIQSQYKKAEKEFFELAGLEIEG